MKTQDNKSILIDLDGEGWKFNSLIIIYILITVYILVKKILL